MPSDVPRAFSPDKGLPPVAPPSGKFLAQLFLVPGLIVLVAVLVVLAFSWFVGGETTPDQMLKRLDSDNPDVRWRAANDLTDRLKRDDDLASDPRLALRLAEMLKKRAKDFFEAQEAWAKRAPQLSDEDWNKERKQLQEKRKDVQFLSPCLGSMTVPAGAPALCELARRELEDVPGWKDMRPREREAAEKSLALLRRSAVWSLANLGENLKRFPQDPTKREAIRKSVEAEAGAGGDLGTWAAQTLAYLRAVEEGGQPGSMGVIPTLAGCDRAKRDPFLREMVAHALNFWHGDPEEEKLAERTLVELSYDSGQGKRIEAGEDD